MARNRNQSKIWQANRAKILEALKDFKSRTVIELAETVKISRWRIYAHLYSMKDAGIVSQEGSRFRLVNPIERMNEQALLTALERIPRPSRLELVMSDSDESHSVTIRQDGEDFRIYEHLSEFATIEIPADDERRTKDQNLD